MKLIYIIKSLSKSVREFKKSSILAPAFVAGEVMLEVLIPTLMAGMIDNGVQKADIGYTWKMGLILLAAASVSLVCGVLSGKFAAKASCGFARNLRHDVFHNIQTFSFANIDRFSPASLVTRLTTDIANIQDAYQLIVRILVRAPLMLIMSMAMAFTLNKSLSLVFLALIPAVAVGIWLIARSARPTFEKVFKTYDELNNVVREDVTAMRTVKAFVREDYESGKFTGTSAKIFKLFKKAENTMAWGKPLMEFAIYTSILLISWFAAKMIVVGTMTTGELMAMIVYSTQVLMSLMMVAMVFLNIVIAETSSQRIVEVLDEKSTMPDAGTLETVSDGGIEFRNVSFSYSGDKEKYALHNATFCIEPGGTVGIIGGTGSGKTTLVQLIPRLYDATEGIVLVGGRDVREYRLDALRKAVAMTLQKSELFSGTVKDNLRWGNENATDEEIVNACRIAQADSFIRQMPDGYDTMIDQGGTNVSGGQRQRLCIARSILKKPKILILDDSANALDTRTDALIRKAFRDEAPRMTKLIISQRIVSVEDADRIIVINNGEIEDIGTSDELLERNTTYREICETQKGGLQNE